MAVKATLESTTPGMKPRAHRFPIRTPVLYREAGRSAWKEGATLNISRSGVLFRAEEDLFPGTMLEMRVQFPAEITGAGTTTVLCWGPVVRTQLAGPGGSTPEIAASIIHYHFSNAKIQDQP